MIHIEDHIHDNYIPGLFESFYHTNLAFLDKYFSRLNDRNIYSWIHIHGLIKMVNTLKILNILYEDHNYYGVLSNLRTLTDIMSRLAAISYKDDMTDYKKTYDRCINFYEKFDWKELWITKQVHEGDLYKYYLPEKFDINVNELNNYWNNFTHFTTMELELHKEINLYNFRIDGCIAQKDDWTKIYNDVTYCIESIKNIISTQDSEYDKILPTSDEMLVLYKNT